MARKISSTLNYRTFLFLFSIGLASAVLYTCTTDAPASAQSDAQSLSTLKADFSSSRPKLPRAQNIHDFSGWKVFNGEGSKIRFLYPNNWMEVKSPVAEEGKYVVSLESPDRSVTGYLISFPAMPRSKIDSYKGSFASALEDRNAGLSKEEKTILLKERFTNVEGQDIYEGFTKTKLKTGGAINQYTFAVINNDTLYELVLTLNSDEIEQKAPLVVRLGESLRVPSSKVNLEPFSFGKKKDEYDDLF